MALPKPYTTVLAANDTFEKTEALLVLLVFPSADKLVLPDIAVSVGAVV